MSAVARRTATLRVAPPTRRPWTVWFCLVFPSAFVVHKYLGVAGLFAYAAAVAAVLAVLPGLAWHPSERAVWRLAAATFLALIVVFALVYPAVNRHDAGAGSDDDDALDIGAAALLQGRSPYEERTYLGNVLHHLPGSFVLAAPFVLLSSSAWQNLLWLPLFFAAATVQARDPRRGLSLLWLMLGLSPVVWQQVVTGSGHLANSLSVLLGLWWLIRTRHRDVAAVAWGVTLASRANFLLLLPLAFAWLRQHRGRTAALRATALTVATCAALTVPFYWHDPGNFGPLDAADRLTRFDALLPHLGTLLMCLTALLALVLACRQMDVVGVRLYGGAAIVLGFPVVAGLVVSSLWAHGWELSYAQYGTFFAPFGLYARHVAARDG